MIGASGPNSSEHYAKSNDILDVWFDSGSTFFHVLRGSHPGTTIPDDDGRHPEADLYLEGHDQHRGWFHSSLLIACAMEGHAPYRGLLTHGFTVDGSGRKMSKSLGNFIALNEVTSKLGAEIIRLWCASTDYSGDLAIDDKILARVVDAYRRIRNTLRFMFANTSDFDVSTDAVPLAEMLEIDRWALARTAALQSDIVGDFDAARGIFAGGHFGAYEFHPVVSKLQIFCSEDLGAFYLDILKDRLYTTASKSLARRSAQTALRLISQAMLRLDGTLPQLHGGRSMEGGGAIGVAVDLRRDLCRRASVDRRGAAREVATHRRRACRIEPADGNPCAPTASSAHRCRPRSRSRPGRSGSTSCWRSATTCALS